MKANTPAARDIAHTVLSVLVIGLLIALSFWILSPFFVSLVWASVIVIATWPVLESIQSRLVKKRGFAVAIMAVMILLVILLPLATAVLTISRNAETVTAQVRTLDTFILSSPPDWIENIPLVGSKLSERWRVFAELTPAERSARITPYAQKALRWFAEQAGSIGLMMLHLLLTVIIAVILYAKGEIVRDGTLGFARRLAGKQGENVAVLAAKAVRGVVLGVVVTALIQATVGGIGLFVTGVAAPGLLAAVMLILCLAQIGPFPVLIPAIIWLYWSGQPVWGSVLIVFSVVAGTLDNFVRPFLIRKGADLPLLLIFSGVIGGLVAFGVIGLFIGPVVLAVTYTLLKEWVSGDAAGDINGSGFA